MGGRAKSQEPQNHWLVLLLFAIAVFSALLLQGFSEGVKSKTRPGAELPAAVARGGTVLDRGGDRPRSKHIPARARRWSARRSCTPRTPPA